MILHDDLLAVVLGLQSFMLVIDLYAVPFAEGADIGLIGHSLAIVSLADDAFDLWLGKSYKDVLRFDVRVDNTADAVEEIEANQDLLSDLPTD